MGELVSNMADIYIKKLQQNSIISNAYMLLPVSVWGSPVLFGHSVVDEISFAPFLWAGINKKDTYNR